MTGVWYPVVLPLALLATCVFFFPSHKAISFRTFKAFLISCDHGQVKKALENWSCKKLSEVTQRSHMQVYSSRFPSRKPKSEKWGQWISSRQYCNNRLLLLSLISDMCNPKNWKSSSTAKWNCSKSGWIRVLQIRRQGRPGKCVFLCDLKCYCQKKPGNSKRSRSAVYLHVFTVWKLSEKMNNRDIWRSRSLIFFEISLFRDFGTSGDLKKHKFWPNLGEVKTYLVKLPKVLVFYP